MHAQSLLSFALVAFTSSTVLADEVATLLLPEMYGHDLVGKVIGTVQDPSRLQAIRQKLN